MKNKHSWSDVDSQLENEGILLLTGAIATYQCSSPIWGLLFGLSSFFMVAHLHDKKAKMWLRNEFNTKLTNGSFEGHEFTEYRLLREQLRKDYPKRDLFIAKLGYWLMITALLYQYASLTSFTFSDLLNSLKMLLH